MKRRERAVLPALSLILIVSLALAQAPSGYAQAQSNIDVTSKSSGQPANVSDPEMSPAVAKALAAMQARIEQLEAELKARGTTAGGVAPANELAPTAGALTAQVLTPPKKEEKPAPAEPFAYADWTWLNGNPRNKDVVWDSKFFTPEVRFDTRSPSE